MLMIIIKYTILIIITFIFQIWVSEFFSIVNIHPDFSIIVILYISVKSGRLVGLSFGFIIGLLIDISSSSAFLGLTPLTYTSVGYFCGFLDGKYGKLNKLHFTLIWVSIVFLQFFIFSIVYHQNLLINNLDDFIVKWMFMSLYTLVFLAIMQIIIPLHKLS